MRRHGDSRAPGTINEDEAPQSMRVMLKPVPPFIFNDEARAIAVEKLFNDARASLLAQSAWIRLSFCHNIPASQCSEQGIVQLTNLLLVCVNEFYLTRSIRGSGPLLPPKIEGWLRHLKEYLPHNEAGFPSTDVWEKDKGNLLRVGLLAPPPRHGIHIQRRNRPVPQEKRS